MHKFLKYLGVAACALLAGLVLARTSTHAASKESHFVKEDQQVTENTYYITAKQAQQFKEQNPNAVVLAVAYGKVPGFSKGHIPGAVQMSTNDVESQAAKWNLLDASQLRKNFLKKGVTADTPLIVYSPDISAASRVVFAAYYLGVKNIKIIDGGQQAWKKAGLPLEKKSVQPKKQTDFGSNTVAHPEAYIKTPADLLKAEKKNPDLKLVSTRSWKEYIGDISGYSYIKETGEPKGAIYGRVSKSSSDVAYLTNADGTIKDPKAELAYWAKKGITPNQEVVFYCGTGWRACVPFFLAKEEGFKNVQLYDGGWYQWNMEHKKDPKKYPVQKGEPGTKNFKVETTVSAER